MSRLIGPLELESASQSRSAHAFIEPFADRAFGIETEKFARGIVHVSDPAVSVGDDDSFLDGIETGLDQPFFLRETQQIILHLLRPDAAKTLDEFLEKTGLHCQTLRESERARNRLGIAIIFLEPCHT